MMKITYLYNPDRREFEKPADPKTFIWRYMDFPKFVSLLQKKALFFCRVDKFGDPYEGSLPIDLFEERGRRGGRKMLRADDVGLIRLRRRNTVANCWHMNEYESAAMWELYTMGQPGVAVKSTFTRLESCIPHYRDRPEQFGKNNFTPQVLHVSIGAVKYIDYAADEFPSSEIFSLSFFKRKSYRHERELRAIIQASPFQGDPYTEDLLEELGIKTGFTEEPVEYFGKRLGPSCLHPVGVYVPIDLDRLIEEIIVSPQAPGWFTELVEKIVQKYRRSYPVRQSDLDKDPVF